MTLEPDTKDWTWVLRTPCPACGFSSQTLDARHVGDRIRALLPVWRQVLARPDAAARRRPDRWSDLEYGCHVRDVLRRFDERVELMLTRDEPHFANWDQDATAVEDRYGEQDPATVAGELEAAGERLASRFDRVAPAQWSRTGVRSDGARFTVESLARYFLHDPVHHLWDVGAPVAE